MVCAPQPSSRGWRRRRAARSHRKHGGVEPAVFADQLDQSPQGAGFGVTGRGVGGARGAVEDDQAARPDQPDHLREEVGVFAPVGRAEDDVVRAVGQPRQDVEGAAVDEPCASVGNAVGGESSAGKALRLGFGVDAREHAIRAHPAKQIQAADPGVGADLDRGTGARCPREQPQNGPGSRADRLYADLGGSRASRRQHGVLGHERLGELSNSHDQRSLVDLEAGRSTARKPGATRGSEWERFGRVLRFLKNRTQHVLTAN